MSGRFPQPDTRCIPRSWATGLWPLLSGPPTHVHQDPSRPTMSMHRSLGVDVASPRTPARSPTFEVDPKPPPKGSFGHLPEAGPQKPPRLTPRHPAARCGYQRNAPQEECFTVVGWAGFRRGASIWSGCSVRIRLWPRLPRDCHRLLSILPSRGASVECPANWCSSLDPTSAGHVSTGGGGR